MSLIFEKSVIGSSDYTLPQTAIDDRIIDNVPSSYLRQSELDLPELSERKMFEHYSSLLQTNTKGKSYLLSQIDDSSRIDGFTGAHPYQIGDACQGAIELLFNVRHMIADIIGADAVSVGTSTKRECYIQFIALLKHICAKRKVILSGEFEDGIVSLFELCGIKTVKADISEIKKGIDGETLCILLKTDDFSDIVSISSKAKENGALLALDMELCREIVGVARPHDMGFDLTLAELSDLFDVSSVNNEETGFVIGASPEYSKYLPLPSIDMDELEQYFFNYKNADAVGAVSQFYGNFTALVKALGFILSNGFEGLKEISENLKINKEYNKK